MDFPHPFDFIADAFEFAGRAIHREFLHDVIEGDGDAFAAFGQGLQLIKREGRVRDEVLDDRPDPLLFFVGVHEQGAEFGEIHPL